MKRRGDLDAIVVGAGSVGSALTLALARAGLDVALVESREPAAWQGGDEIDARVVALAPDSRRLLDELGVWGGIRDARACPYRRMRVWDGSAGGELVLDASELGTSALGWIVENRLIQDVLWRALQTGDFAAPPRILCPAQIVSIENDVGGASVLAIASDGSRLRSRVLIAAEGANSSLRELLAVGVDDRDYRQRAVVAHVRTARSHEGTAWQRFQPGGPLAFLPLGDGRSSVVWSMADHEAERVLALADDAFRGELGAAFDFRLGAIEAATPRMSFPLRMRLADRYVAGRCVLAGDAAHTVHPLAGQGMNLGLRDARCLRDVLVAARERGADLGAAHVLRRYERERRSENTLAAHGLDAIERVFAVEALPLAVLRGMAFGIAGRSRLLRRLLVDVAAGAA